MTRNSIRTTKMLRVYCRRFLLLLSTQLEDHLHRKLPQLYSRTVSKAVRSAQQHLVQISTTASLHYFSVMICFPSSWELVRRRELAFLIVPSPAPSTTCGLQSLLSTESFQWAVNIETVFGLKVQLQFRGWNCLRPFFLPFSLSTTSVQQASPSLTFTHDLVQA